MMMNNPFDQVKPKHPKSTAVLVLGICSLAVLLLTACCALSGFVSLILGIVTLVLSKNAREDIRNNYQLYHPDSFREVEAGRIMGIISTILSSLAILLVVILFIIYGAIIFLSLLAK
jgi:uncharacterized membrane protein YjjP (DUF1212 family)